MKISLFSLVVGFAIASCQSTSPKAVNDSANTPTEAPNPTGETMERSPLDDDATLTAPEAKKVESKKVDSAKENAKPGSKKPSSKTPKNKKK